MYIYTLYCITYNHIYTFNTIYMSYTKVPTLSPSSAISKHSKRLSEQEQELRSLLDTLLSPPPKKEKRSPAPTPLPSPPPPPPALSVESKAGFLLELAQLCLDQGLPQLCRECVAALPRDLPQTRLALLRVTVAGQLTLVGQAERNGHNLYSKTAVEVGEVLNSAIVYSALYIQIFTMHCVYLKVQFYSALPPQYACYSPGDYLSKISCYYQVLVEPTAARGIRLGLGLVIGLGLERCVRLRYVHWLMRRPRS